jgi:hypothetical protein
MAEITNNEIIEAAKAPQSVAVDGVSVANRSTDELIRARDDVANNSNATSPRRGLLFAKLIPGSAVGQ